MSCAFELEKYVKSGTGNGLCIELLEVQTKFHFSVGANVSVMDTAVVASMNSLCTKQKYMIEQHTWASGRLAQCALLCALYIMYIKATGIRAENEGLH